MLKNTLIAATAVAALTTAGFAGDLSPAGTTDAEIIIPVIEETGSSAGSLGSLGLLGSAGGAAVPAVIGLAVLAAAAASGGS